MKRFFFSDNTGRGANTLNYPEAVTAFKGETNESGLSFKTWADYHAEIGDRWVSEESTVCRIEDSKEPEKPKNKFILITIKERNGEQEYTQRIVRAIGKRASAEKAADYEARTWYDDKPEKDERGYYHLGGTVHVSVSRVNELTEEEYNVFAKYF